MIVKMRNKQTGEFRDVQLDSPEFLELQATVTPAGFPAWEQTSHVHAADVRERATYAELLESDLGEDYKERLKHEALILDAEGVGPENNPHLALSPGEVEAGLTPQSKLEQIRKAFADSVPTREDILSKAAEHVAEGEVKPRRGPDSARGLRARAGGSDDRDNAPKVDATHQDEGGSEQQGEDGEQKEPTQAQRVAAATASGKSGEDSGGGADQSQE
jgi:hypothetical protein